jgi:hypothetical protein
MVSTVRSYKYIASALRRGVALVTQVLPRAQMIPQVQPIPTPEQREDPFLLTASAEISRLGSQ